MNSKGGGDGAAQGGEFAGGRGRFAGGQGGRFAGAQGGGIGGAYGGGTAGGQGRGTAGAQGRDVGGAQGGAVAGVLGGGVGGANGGVAGGQGGGAAGGLGGGVSGAHGVVAGGWGRGVGGAHGGLGGGRAGGAAGSQGRGEFTWVKGLNGAFGHLKGALVTVNNALTDMEGDESEMTGKIRKECHQAIVRVRDLDKVLGSIIRTLAQPDHELNKKLIFPGLVQAFYKEALAVYQYSHDMDRVTLSEPNLRFPPSFRILLAGFSRIHMAMAVFHHLLNSVENNLPNNLLGLTLQKAAMMLQFTVVITRSTADLHLNDGLPEGNANGPAAGGIVHIASRYLERLRLTEDVLRVAHRNIHSAIDDIHVARKQKNLPIAVKKAVKNAVKLMRNSNSQMPSLVEQMHDAGNHIRGRINFQAHDHGTQILRPFHDQMHQICERAEAIHQSGASVHSGLLVCIENQILGLAQTTIQCDLAQVYLQLSKVLLATQAFAGLLDPAADH